jgi:hypothetical protein
MNMKHLLTIAAVLALTACASPTLKMTDQEIASLNDSQLCDYKNNYSQDDRRDREIARRGLICDPYARECLARGNTPGSEAMGFCVATLRENARLRYENSRDDFDFMYGMHHHHRGSGVGIGLGL